MGRHCCTCWPSSHQCCRGGIRRWRRPFDLGGGGGDTPTTVLIGESEDGSAALTNLITQLESDIDGFVGVDAGGGVAYQCTFPASPWSIQYAEYPPPDPGDDTFLTLVNCNILFAGQPSPGDSITFGATTYVADTDFLIGADVEATIGNFLSAIAENPAYGAGQYINSPSEMAYVIFIGDTGTVEVSGTQFSFELLGVIQMKADPAPGKTIEINGTTYEFVA